MVEENKIQELVAQAKGGDQQAFSSIFELLSKPVYNFLIGRVRQKETAEDLVQTVFLKAWRNLDTYRTSNKAKFSTWLFQIANYTLIDYWRTRKDTVDISSVENLSIFALDPKLYEKYDWVNKALSELPTDYQTVLELRFRQDMTVAETSHIMGKTQVGIRVLQHRALKALRSKLSKYQL